MFRAFHTPTNCVPYNSIVKTITEGSCLFHRLNAQAYKNAPDTHNFCLTWLYARTGNLVLMPDDFFMTLRTQGSICLCLVELILKVVTKDKRQTDRRSSTKDRTWSPRGNTFLCVGVFVLSDM